MKHTIGALSFGEISYNEAKLILGFEQFIDNSNIEMTPRTYRDWKHLCAELSEFIKAFDEQKAT